ncbi:hypothetical protein QBC41DRAFT_259772 [Cercophora samala]|uniref:DUF7587 domain-containing protein n=1 Tax=Cercophora samala TaxID=330535 RepID=A0AA39Z4M8_9PEZI|nr:hypothetical protein QBC41DRAFT_259772 [Cercophora samala]
MASFTAQSSEHTTAPQSEDLEPTTGIVVPPSPAKNEETASTESEDADDYMSINTMVPVEHVVIMRLGPTEVDKYDVPEHDAYLVNHSDNEGLREGPTIWEKEGSTITAQITATYAVPFKSVTKKRSPVGDDGSRLFPGGRPILLVKSTIPTCGGQYRPRLLMRVVHEGRKGRNGDMKDGPAPSTKARGHGVVSLNPINRQIFMQKHFTWSCHQLSPFLSVTDSWKTAMIRLASFFQHGFINPKILVIDSTHRSWDHDQSKLFNAAVVIKRLHLRWREWHRNEYLVESSIPEESIIRTMSLEEAKMVLPDLFATAIQIRTRMDQKNEELREYLANQRERGVEMRKKLKSLGILDKLKSERRKHRGKIRKLHAAVAAAAAGDDGGDSAAAGPAPAGSTTVAE